MEGPDKAEWVDGKDRARDIGELDAAF